MDLGKYIKQRVIPEGMSVTEAAKKLGVGRPALSNLLNGRASLSPTMALRLERVFHANQEQLLDLQAQADRDRTFEESREIPMNTYAPRFLSDDITARRISEWAAGNIAARDQLPVLLRVLINSTGRDLSQVVFPGGDNAQRQGWDGRVNAAAATPWIPEGQSGWELSTTQRPVVKANRDYAARLAVDAAERAACTFVFVTTCNWPGKDDWARSKQALGDWKAVRAYDASDLEHWLEASIPGQVWLAKELGMPTSGVETLDHCWSEWAAASEPPMTGEIFEPSVAAHGARFQQWLDSEPSERPLVVTGDSKNEALAFLACLFQANSISVPTGIQVAVFKSAEALGTLTSSSWSFIAVACNEETEQELASVYRERHCIVVRPRNSVDRKPDIAVELHRRDTFESALADMGIAREDFGRWSRESGRSPTVLRRRLSRIDAIRRPNWAQEQVTANSLIPFVMVGAWNNESEADQAILSELSGVDYAEVERTITSLLDLEDCPVWSAGVYSGVISKIDIFFNISRLITRHDLGDFFRMSERVLSEPDPSLELPEDQRWAAAVYDKVRRHSTTLRSGICETLVLLAVHGNELFQDRLGLNVHRRVSRLIRKLLDPLTINTLLSHERDLPHYAEAAPDELLGLIEEDLAGSKPAVLDLLKPTDSGVLGSCPRTGLLWALECIAWNEKYLARVSLVLAELSKTELSDNWANKPIASLESIYRSWFPQTAASLNLRIKGLEMLLFRLPDIGWQVCVHQFGTGSQMGMSTYRPRWRADATGAGQLASHHERFKFARKALDFALSSDREHDSSKLGDLIDRLNAISAEDQSALWDLIDNWSDTETGELERAQLRERIRRVILAKRREKLTSDTWNLALAAYEKLKPADVVLRHRWLFISDWVDVPDDEWINEPTTSDHGDQFDFDKEEEWVHIRRAAAMNEIWVERGCDGIAALLEGSDAAFVVGRYAALTVAALTDACSVLRGFLSVDVDRERRIEAFLRGFIINAIQRVSSDLLVEVSETATTDEKVRLFVCAPFDGKTWRLLDHEEPKIRDIYWREVQPHRNRHNESEVNELLDNLLAAKRPKEAFRAVEWEWKKIETSRLKRLMMMIATTNDKSDYSYEPDSFYISHALRALDVRADVSEAEMAQLELFFIDALDNDEYGIPNLERQIEDSPDLFVHCLALLYRRDDGGQDPPSWQIKNSEQRAAATTNAYRLLRRLRRIPGSEADGTIDTKRLHRWVLEVRRLCTEHGRAGLCDQHIGQLLTNAPSDEDGVWPCRAVCDVMETVRSKQLAYGFHLGERNARGVHERGDGGDQERELSAKYGTLASRLDFEYPFVSSVLEDIARAYDTEAHEEDSAASVRHRLIL